jgi:formiminoglutamase
MNTYFQKYAKTDLSALVRFRKGETKFGELVSVPGDESISYFLESTSATYIVLGVAEDIGVLANHGIAGTAETWKRFLNFFLNIQANNFTKANSVAVIGHFSFDSLRQEIDEKHATEDERISEYRRSIEVIDDVVSELIHMIVSHKKIPIVIGGGHNNAYPILKGTASALALAKSSNHEGINCINLDAHTDYRNAEGRHSGNGFRYAKMNGYLNKYFVVGIHENYLPDHIIKELADEVDIRMVAYEDIFVRETTTWFHALKDAAKFTGNFVTGIELDLDSISNVASSATTPCGVTPREALQYINYVASHCDVGYLHICEGIASEANEVAKLITYLVTQFVKSNYTSQISGQA